MAVPTTEPRVITAGDNIAFDKTLSDYSAASYLLSYVLAPIAGGDSYSFTGTPDGDTHDIRVTPATTLGFVPGDYLLTSYVTDLATSGATTAKTLESLRVLIKPAVTSEAVDRRTFAEKMVSKLQDTYSKLAGNSIQTAAINGRSYTRSNLAELRAEIVHWEDRVRNEQGGASRKIAVRFQGP